jgi:hypothetical protein
MPDRAAAPDPSGMDTRSEARGERGTRVVLTFLLLVTFTASGGGAAEGAAPPPELEVAFIGDQGLGGDAEAVLRLIRDEGAQAVFHQGDFDYEDDPAAWEAQIDAVLGPDFPYFASIGNHDALRFFGPGGYHDRLAARMERLGIPWEGMLGVRSTFHWQGLFVVMTAPGVLGGGDLLYAPYIRDALAADDSIWTISSWHENMRAMQVGGKSDSTGWDVYEESRRGGAIVATAHEHSYSRTHLLADVENQVVASTAEPLVLAADDPVTPADEGRSFVFVSGLGGQSIRDQELDGPWWASIYTSDQGARPGALFAVFHVDGNPRLARFYFKDIEGNVVDEFLVESAVGAEGEPPEPPPDDPTPPAPDDPTPPPDDPTPPPDDPTPPPEPPDDPPAPPDPTAACADGLDNDGDTLVDFPADAGCRSPRGRHERKKIGASRPEDGARADLRGAAGKRGADPRASSRGTAVRQARAPARGKAVR